MVDDSRYRTLLYLTDPTNGLQSANMLKSDAVTPLTVHNMFTAPYIPYIWLFNGLGNDVVNTIGTAESKPQFTQDHNTYAYIENIPITIYAADSETVDGTKARWQVEAELRRIVEANYGGSLGTLRRLTRMGDNEQDMGGWRLYSVKYDLEYKRANSNYTPTYPTFSYGRPENCWNYDGDRGISPLPNGVEGAWSTSGAGATQTIDNGDYIALTRAAADCSTTHATSLALTTTISKKIRWRYKCSNANVTARITVYFTVGSGGGSQVLFTKANSTTFTVGSTTLTTAKVVNNVVLEALDAAGTVYYDYVEIYEDDYILPNCINLVETREHNDAPITVPSFIGGYSQALGSLPKKIVMTSDLDCEGATITWKRPQTGTPTDKINTRVFEEIQHAEAKSIPWHWLNYGKGSMKARLVSFEPNYGNDHILKLIWIEQRPSSAGNANENADTRFTIDQVA